MSHKRLISDGFGHSPFPDHNMTEVLSDVAGIESGIRRTAVGVTIAAAWSEGDA
jgi:hypothetical protein